MNKGLFIIIFFVFTLNINASVTKPDSTYCSWYDLSIEFWENQNRSYFEYNDDELITNELRQIWNASINDWENQVQYATLYNDVNLIAEYKGIKWENDWINDWHETFLYNSSGKVTEWTSQIWNNSTEVWTGGEQYVYEYDAGNKEISKVYKEWNSSGNNFIDVSRWLSTYEADLLTIKIFQEINNNIWRNKYRYVYTYSTNNLIISNVKQNWNANINKWESDGKTIYVYDNMGNVIEKTDQYWNSSLQLWVNDTRYVYIYESNSLLASEERQFWHIDTWKSNWKNEFNYNTQGLKTELIYAQYDQDTEEWVYITKQYFAYNQQNKLIEFTAQKWDDNLNNWLNDYRTTISGTELIQTELFENWDTIRNSWVYENKCVDYFSWPASVNHLRNNYGELVIYPNPVHNYLNLNTETDFREIQIYSMDGKLVRSMNKLDKRSMNIANLPTGNYFLKAIDKENKINIGKFIKD